MDVNDQPSVACLSNICDIVRIAERCGVQLDDKTRNDILRHTLNGLGIWVAQKVVKRLVQQKELVWDHGDYEVEAILDYAAETKEGDKVDIYLVKWAGWTFQHATWEPKSHLDCPDILKEFHRLRDEGKSSKDITNALCEMSKKERFSKCKTKMEDIYEKLRDEKIAPDRIFSLARSLSKRKAEHLQEHQPHKRKCLRVNQTIINKRSKAYRVMKEERDQALKQWERNINTVDKNQAYISVENKVDLEGPPDNFVYINDYMAGEGVEIPSEPVVGCECDNCYETKNSCCGPSGGGCFAYNKTKRLRVPPGTPIYECNTLCKCGPDCPNRVVQLGRKRKVCIFKTANGRGWGVKAMQNIKKGTFVGEYVGEVITNEEAERRGHIYDGAGRTYLFDLDYNDDDCPFTVDAGRYGNMSHFINHSCDPNLAVYGIWINSLDPRLPRIALFAQRNIAREEELTFDYMMTGEMTGGLSAHANVSGSNLVAETTEEEEDEEERTPPPELSTELGAAPSLHRAEAEAETEEDGEVFLKPPELSVSTLSSSMGDVKSKVASMPPTPPPSIILEETKPVPSTAPAGRAPASQYRVVCQCGAKACRGYLY